VDIVKMKKQLEDMRADRVARGLPPSPPDQFVPCEVGYLLMERHKHLFDYFVRYATLCNEANEKLPINAAKFDQCKSDLHLIRKTINGGPGPGCFATGILAAIAVVKKADEKSTSEYLRCLYMALQLAKLGVDIPLSSVAYDFNLTSTENRKLYENVVASYERYKSDEALLNAELERLRAHYESIKHLY
jgi:hypothetical protein